MKFTGYDFLKKWEGEELKAYKDGGGVWTIGYGHTKTTKPGMVISLDKAKALLDEDLKDYEKAVNDTIKVPMNQNQYNAFVSLAYNVGASGFAGSTAAARFNKGDQVGAAEAITWWNKDNGKVVKGLVNRRASEKELFMTPVSNLPKEEDIDTIGIDITLDNEAIRALVDKFLRDLKVLVETKE